MHQRVNTFIAVAGVAAFGLGAAYLIIDVASKTEFSYMSTDESYIFTAEIRRNGLDVDVTTGSGE
jgi:hypothetical protein